MDSLMASPLASAANLLFAVFASLCTTILLSYTIVFSPWESVVYSPEKASSNHLVISTSFFDSKVLVSNQSEMGRFFLIPTTAGIWSICLDLSESELKELHNAYEEWIEPKCINTLSLKRHSKDTSLRGLKEQRRLRMNNLIISCSTTCIIILISCLIIFPIGLVEKQAPSIFIVSVLYILSGLFAVFALGIWEMSKGVCGSSLLGSRLNTTGSKNTCLAGTYTRGKGFYTGWTGVVMSLLTAGSLYFLSKALRDIRK